MALRFYNTLARKKQVFKPIKEGFVGIYSCGPTVYNYPHIGNYRAYVFGDILAEYLKYRGFRVKKVQNITDVDDKTIRDSQAEGISLKEFTERYTAAFFEDLETLNIARADVHPKATEHIPEMVELIKKLLEKKYAYKTDDGCVYFSVKKFKRYGKLSRIDLSALKAGASGRMLADEYEKELAQDFALWKAWDEKDGDVFWETDIGKGRPGWHIECSAMSMKYLGETFDIHTGGVDLVFPHHENEIAQSEAATGKKFVNYWLHNEHLLVDGKKMSKSLGNFYTLRDILARGADPLAIRYLLLSTHYRQKLNFSFEGLDAAKKAVERLHGFMKRLDEATGKAKNPKVSQYVEAVKKRFEAALDNDLDMPKALGALFVFVRKINSLLSSGKMSKDDSVLVKETMRSFDRVLKILPKKEEELSDEVKKLIAEREEARKIKNWARADELREELRKKGIVLEDTPHGVRWRKV